ncbi:nuclear transport factor 2 family protein [Flavobacterium sp. UBA6135]|uniref:nuclear transport factor 2 family protein n=1 Tax=Flavobacterium sp. UBA6135 TaxID=1946553 RepID=UPI0025BD75B0|nr:nuclear transport factor 2 family protein [Flavobacterium sp. UBA6135]
MHSTSELISDFYTAFQQLDAKKMAACYHEDATFEDPAFGKLNYEEVCAMWKMLIERSNGHLKIEYSQIDANDNYGSVNWIAKYNFSKTNRKVRNVIKAKFEFKNGLIYCHKDCFDLWKWSQMALGWKGYLFGWTSFMKRKIQLQAKNSLQQYLAKN